MPPDPGGSSEGFQALQDILRLAPATKVIVVTGREEKENAVRAIGLGACDFFQKPLDADILSFIVNRAFRLYELEKENQELSTGNSVSTIKGVIASSPKMLEICRMIEKIAPADVTTLLLGETGTGKEVLAKAIHQLSNRSDEPFSAINCGAIPENLLESELFGHEKGSFTGATQMKKGKIELADGGTLFLDEIGDMPLPLQVKLLRFLQERVIERIGSVKVIPVDVRVVCATHQNLQSHIEQGLFREDLYYRVSEITLNIPPLKEREGDSIIIAQALLKTISQSMNRPNLSFSEDAMHAIKSYHWPGNVRELRHAVHRAFIMSDPSTKVIELPSSFQSPFSLTKKPANNVAAGQTIESVEKELIMLTLEKVGGQKTAAAEMLGISTKTLYNRLHSYEDLTE